MTNILDTVEPDCVRYKFETAAGDAWRWDSFWHGEYKEAQHLYSRETVESLLEAHRKQVLLEAAVICEAHGSLLPDLSDESLTAFDLCAELRRMAEGEE